MRGLNQLAGLEKHSKSEGGEVDRVAMREQEEGTCVEKQISVSLGAAEREFEAVALQDKDR